jgi:hypothetical protein
VSGFLGSGRVCAIAAAAASVSIDNPMTDALVIV